MLRVGDIKNFQNILLLQLLCQEEKFTMGTQNFQILIANTLWMTEIECQ